ncbi:hypothetical protein HJ588_12025 [Flexivirga sp. ID2601S]|uniref:Uncharacterized protein n=1 Tax=Flexivirga aerilata TaxID=1656889 RepID=A0A849ATD0_9MICO|nr:hypothetical protein [Flexivirga aerilata]NNG39992.1 hypothetical protein [Flexivirga aerilata]
MVVEIVLAVLCLIGATFLIAQTVVQRRIWRRHQNDVAIMRQWQEETAGAPYDQLGSGPPPVTSPYAVAARPLPPRPGAGRLIWVGVLVAIALILLLAASA